MSEFRHGEHFRQMRHACVDCGKLRWTQVIDERNGGHPRYERCRSCSTKQAYTSGRTPRPLEELSTRWNGGITKKLGYKMILISRDSPWHPMANGGSYLGEHRLVMATHLGRLLTKEELVHHKNGNRLDNRIANLLLLNKHNHHGFLYTQALQQRIRELEDNLQELIATS